MSESQRWKNIMKAIPFEEKRLAKWEPPYIVQPKYDGVRCRAVPLSDPQGHSCVLLSSEENIIHSVPHLNEIINDLNLSIELDGELYCHGMNFEEIVSITSRTVNLHPDFQRIQFHVFDIITDQSQIMRTLSLENLRDLSPHLVISPSWICQNLDEVKKVYDDVLSLNYEGIIVRNAMAPYERKRSTWIMKFKPKRQDTYQIVDWQEEVSKDGVPKGRIGAIILKSQDGDIFGVSAGLNDDEKEKYWNARETLPGKNAIVHYQHLTDKKIPKGCFDIEIV